MSYFVSRSRSRGGFATQGTYQVVRSDLGLVAAGPGTLVGEKETMVDTPTPNFRKRSEKGEIIMNFMDKVKWSRSASTISSYFGTVGLPALPTGKNLGDLAWYDLQLGTAEPLPLQATLHSPEAIDSAEVEACTACLSQIGRSNTDMWENLAEAGKTIELLNNPIRSFFAYHRKVTTKTLADTPAKAWLLYQFGVKPLISSCQDVLENLRKMNRPQRVTSRGKATSTQRSELDAFWVAGSHTRRYRIQKTETLNVRAMSIDAASWNILTDLGLSGKSLLTLPWELVRYSFVIDYFANVGAYLGSLANVFQPASLGQCYVREWDIQEVRTSYAHTTSGVDTIYTPGLSRSEERTVRKTRFPMLRTPGIVVKSDFRLDNAVRIGNLLAIASQLVSRQFRRDSWKLADHWFEPNSGRPH